MPEEENKRILLEDALEEIGKSGEPKVDIESSVGLIDRMRNNFIYVLAGGVLILALVVSGLTGAYIIDRQYKSNLEARIAQASPTAALVAESPTSIPTYTPTEIIIPSNTPLPTFTYIPTNTSLPTPTKTPIPPTPIPRINPTPPQQVVMEGPFRQHYQATIGTGLLANVTYSDGMAEYSQYLLDSQHPRIQRFRPEENPDGCGVSRYNTNKIWFSSAASTEITVNGNVIAYFDIIAAAGHGTIRHGYIFEYPLKVDDRICVSYVHPSGYQIVFGPDLYYHYDSYCYRGHC